MLALGWTAEARGGRRAHRAADGLVAVEAAVAIDRGAAIERLVGLARTDAPTASPTPRWEDELAREDRARATCDGTPLSIALLYLDLAPSLTTDTHGDAAGDQVLQLDGRGLDRAAAGAADVLARWGGDELRSGAAQLRPRGRDSELLSRLLAGKPPAG